MMKRFVSLLLAIVFVSALSVSASARLVGDVNSDGKTNTTDALMILKYSVGKTVENMKVEYADVNADGKANSTDALVALQISVGKYDGDLEVEDEFVTSYKAELVDPIMATGEYTLVTQADIEGETSTVTIIVNGDDLCVDTLTGDVNIRMVYLAGKTYMAISAPNLPIPLVKGIYGEIDGELKPSGTSANAEYIKSERVVVYGTEYICESYKLSDGTVTQYYFKDGKWAMMGTVEDGMPKLQTVVSLKEGIDVSYFSFDGYAKVDMNKLLGGATEKNN